METPDDWRKVRRIFRSAWELPPSECAALLDRICGGDHALCREVEQMLATGRDAPHDFLEPPKPYVEVRFVRSGDRDVDTGDDG